MTLGWFDYLGMIVTISTALLTVAITSYRFNKESEYVRDKNIADGEKRAYSKVKEMLSRQIKLSPDAEQRDLLLDILEKVDHIR